MLEAAIFFVAGTLFGSFINAAAWRIHRGESVVTGRSRCTRCEAQLAWYDLIPVLSWLWLRGRCRYCGEFISRRYPAIEIITGGLFAWSYLVWDFTTPYAALNLGFWLAILVGLVLLADYDTRWMLLPDKVLLHLLAVAVVQQVTVTIATGQFRGAIDAALAATLASLFFYGLFAYSRGRWMGGGDVKLVFLMGLVLGLANTLIALLIAFNVAALVSLTLIALRKMSRKDHIPFGPFLIGGTVVAMFYGATIFEAYQRIFLLS